MHVHYIVICKPYQKNVTLTNPKEQEVFFTKSVRYARFLKMLSKIQPVHVF